MNGKIADTEMTEAQRRNAARGSMAWHPEVTDFLTLRIGIVAKLIDRHASHMLASRFRMTLAEWRVLSQLAITSNATVRALAEGMSVDRAEVSRAATSLIRRGCVRRSDNPADRRSPLFACTEEGLKLFRAVRPVRRKFQAALATELTPDQLAGLGEALDRLTLFLQEDKRFK